MPQFLRNCGRGYPAGGLRAAFSTFWVAPEAQRDKISLSAESEEGSALHPPAF